MKLTSPRERQPRVTAASALEAPRPDNPRAEVDTFLHSPQMAQLRELAHAPYKLQLSEQELLINGRWVGSLDPVWLTAVRQREELKKFLKGKVAEDDVPSRGMVGVGANRTLAPGGDEIRSCRVAAIYFQLFPEDRPLFHFDEGRLGRRLIDEEGLPFPNRIAGAYDLCVIWPDKKQQILRTLFTPQELTESFSMENFIFTHPYPTPPHSLGTVTRRRRKPVNLLAQFLVMFPEQRVALAPLIRQQQEFIINDPSSKTNLNKQRDLIIFSADSTFLDEQGCLQFVFKKPKIAGHAPLPERPLA